MFSPETSKGSSPSLIPDKTLHFASVNVQGIGTSKTTGGSYAKLELILIQGPYEGRRLYTIIMNPTDPKNVNQAKRAENKPDGAMMGLTALTRAFEACRIFDVADPSTYKRLDGRDFGQICEALNGQRVAVKIKLVPAKDGYDEKNEVSEWLSPNPQSGGYIGWKRLIGGENSVQQARAGAFGAPAAPAAGGFLQPPRASAPAQAPAPSNRPAWVDEAPSNPSQNPFG